MADAPAPRNENPLLSLLGKKDDTKVNTEKVAGAISVQTGQLNTQLTNLSNVFKSVGESIKSALQGIEPVVPDDSDGGKEARQEQRKMFSNLFKGLGKTISGSLDKLGMKMNFDTVGSGIMSLLKPVILIAAAYIFRTFKVIQTAGKIITGIFKGLPKLFKGLKTIFGGAFKLLKGPITGLFARLGGFMQKILAKSGLGKVFSTIVTKLKPLFDGVTKVGAKIAPVFKTIGGFFGKIGNFAKGAGGVATKVGGVFGTVGKVLKPVFGIFKPLVGFVSKIGKFFKAVPILGQVITVIEGIVGFFRGFFGSEGSFFDKLIGGVKGIFAQIISGLTFGLLSFDDVMGFFDSVTSVIGDFFSMIFVFFDEHIKPIIDMAVDGIISLFKMIWNFYTVTIPNFIMSAIDAVIGFFTETIPGFFKGMVDTVVGFFSDPITYIKEQFSLFVSQAKIMFLQLRMYVADLLSYIGLGEDTEELQKQIDAERKSQKEIFIARAKRQAAEKQAEKQKAEAAEMEAKAKPAVVKTEENKDDTESLAEFQMRQKKEERLGMILNRTGLEGQVSPAALETFMERNPNANLSGAGARQEMIRIQEEEIQNRRRDQRESQATQAVVVNNSSNNTQSFEVQDEPATDIHAAKLVGA